MTSDIHLDVIYHLFFKVSFRERGELMRRSNEEAAQTREAIVDAASDHLRRTGIAEASVADMMAAAGLTHGGFYRHFCNKGQLVAEALSAAGAKTIATISRNLAKGGI